MQCVVRVLLGRSGHLSLGHTGSHFDLHEFVWCVLVGTLGFGFGLGGCVGGSSFPA